MNTKIKKIRIADYLVNKLNEIGLDKVFLITGGGAMHLNDAFTRNKKMRVTFMHHEQALAMAADGYARVTNKPAIVNVTTGPGGINALNGVFGAFVDSISMVVVSGQVRTETIARINDKSLRQLGDQEADIYSTVQSSVKYYAMPKTKSESIYAIKRALFFIQNGRPGPVWVDVPINIQSVQITHEEILDLELKNSCDSLIEYIHPNNSNEMPNIENLNRDVDSLILDIKMSKRPVFLAGTGIRISNQQEKFIDLLDELKIPGVTGWNAHDIIPYNHDCYSGKPGTQGDRPGNFTIKNADLVVVFGCRLNIRQISYNWQSFAASAKIIMIDIDKSEMNKSTLNINHKMHYRLQDFVPAFSKAIKNWNPQIDHIKFLNWCKLRVNKYPVVNGYHFEKLTPVNPYAFFSKIYNKTIPGDTVVVGNGSACVIGFQAAVVKKGVRLFTNSGCASMGYDLPAAIGSALASHPKNKRVICIAGDGSLMMNIQELASVSHMKLPIKIFILDNDGYHSIRQTQSNYFPDNLAGTSSSDGIGFPNFLEVGKAFGINSKILYNLNQLDQVLNSTEFSDNTPQVFIVKLDILQQFEPKLRSKQLEDGSMSTPELHDMYPFLSAEEIKDNLIDS